MVDSVEISIPSLRVCPDCGTEAHNLTFVPVVDPDGTRVLTDLARRCANAHQFATAMPDIPLPTWRRGVETSG